MVQSTHKHKHESFSEIRICRQVFDSVIQPVLDRQGRTLLLNGPGKCGTQAAKGTAPMVSKYVISAIVNNGEWTALGLI
jgi:hypothetical protein